MSVVVADGNEGLKAGTLTARVPNHADGKQRRSFEDGNGLDDFTSTTLGSRTFNFTDNGGPPDFEACRIVKNTGISA